MILFHAVPHDQIMQLQMHRQPGYRPGAQGDMEAMSNSWLSCEALEMQSWSAAEGMTDCLRPSLRDAAKSLAASEPFLQTALQQWASECPTLTGVGRWTQTSIGPCLDDLRRVMVRLPAGHLWCQLCMLWPYRQT